MKKIFLILFASLLVVSCSKVRVADLTVEQLHDPLNIHKQQPRFGWVIESSKPDVMQTAYELLVASDPKLLEVGKADVWHSGKVESSQSVWVPYGGPQLKSQQQLYWSVKVYTTQGESAWSEPASWAMGLLDSSDWKAQWIGCDTAMAGDVVNDSTVLLNARYLRHEFATSGQQVVRAVAHICGLGLYNLYINGQRVGNAELAPIATDWRRSVIYDSYDVTSLIGSDNAVGVVLGMGRYMPWRPGHFLDKDHDMFGFPKLLFQLEITYADGTSQTVASDTSWRLTNQGPVRHNHEFDGENYDARLDLGKWTSTGYDDASWQQALPAKAPAGQMVGGLTENMKVMQTVQAVAVKPTQHGTYIVDFGQNVSGRAVVAMHHLAAGDSVVMRFAEILKPSGDSLYVDNLRSAKCTDIYIASGSESNTPYHVSFITHGFRYMELEGLDEPKKEDFSAEVIFDNIETLGHFECSNDVMNAIHRNAWWGIADNYKGMPMDCCQRDERMPWLGDRAAGCYGESFVFGINNLYAKWMRDVREAQDTNGNLPNIAPTYWRLMIPNLTWPSVLPMCSDMLYWHYGNIEPVQLAYKPVADWLHYIMSIYMDADSIITKDQWGDWCMPPESPEIICSEDPARNTDGGLMSTAYFVMISNLMADYAVLLHHDADVPMWQKYAHDMTMAFNKRYLHHGADSVYYGNNTVTSNVLPLAFGMVPEDCREAVQKSMVDRIVDFNKCHISCGVVGMAWIQRQLSRMGQGELAFQLATQTTWPSYGYMIEHGATTIWELWNGDTADPAMNSGNHVMLLGDLLHWCYKDLAGIQPAEAGFKSIRFSPDFSVTSLEWVKCSYKSLYGTIESNYRRTADGHIEWDVVVPCNTTAVVALPDGDKQVGSGKYHFVL